MIETIYEVSSSENIKDGNYVSIHLHHFQDD
jgi:hypothetical protein